MQGTVHAGVEGAERPNRGWRAKKSLLHSQKRRVKEKVVLPDPRSHQWKLELHYVFWELKSCRSHCCWRCPPKLRERERDKMKECSFSTPPALHSPITIPQWLNYLEARKQENWEMQSFANQSKVKKGGKRTQGKNTRDWHNVVIH